MRCEMCQMKVIHTHTIAEEKGWYMAAPVARRSFVKPKVIDGNLLKFTNIKAHRLYSL